jgi:hypothetical protein
MASGQAKPTGLAINGTYLVWANTGDSSVMKLPIAGGTPSVVVAPTSGTSIGLATPYITLDSTNVYWTAQVNFVGYLYRVPFGGGASVELDSCGGGVPSGIALNAATVYWICGTQLRSASVNGGSVDTLANSLSKAGTLATDGANAYWVELGGQFVESLPLSGGAPMEPSQNATTDLGIGIASDGTNIYWGPGLKAPVGGGTTTMLGISLAGSQALALDATAVYAAIYQANGAIVKAPIDGSPGRSLAVNQNSPYGVVVDATYAYWTNSGAGTILRVPK